MIPVACCFDDCKVPSCCLGRLLLYLVLSVCVEPFLRFNYALYETCLVLHVVSSCHVASMFGSVCDCVLLAFASMPCLTCFVHIFQAVAPN